LSFLYVKVQALRCSSKINIFNLLGQRVKELINEFKQAGEYTVSFNGTNFSSGIYYYKITAGGFEEIRKMVLLK